MEREVFERKKTREREQKPERALLFLALLLLLFFSTSFLGTPSVPYTLQNCSPPRVIKYKKTTAMSLLHQSKKEKKFFFLFEFRLFK
jgi:hypothetical protein